MKNRLPHTLQVINEYQKTTPIDVLAIANRLKINVYEAIENENLSGKIVKDEKYGGDSGYAIFVNSKHSKTRQRFTIAHEIAHYLLHRDAIGNGVVDDALYRSGLSNSQEREANKLAAEILMPWHLINEILDEKFKNIQELAAYFNVSESAMSIRLGIPN